MNRSRLIARAMLALAAAACGMWVAARAPAPDPLAARPCVECHVTSGTVEVATAGVLQGSQETLCRDCHPRAVVASHPSGVKPSMVLGGEFPTDWKGELTCSTCHQVHGAIHGALRGAKRRREFCLACHPQSFFDRMADAGQSLLVSGHLDATGTGEGDLLDPFTAQCMTCHGENGDGRVRIDGARNTNHSSNGINHPVGVDYAKASRFGSLRSESMLDPTVELPGGLVSCISCHQGYSERHGAIRHPQRGGLCLECHDL